MTRSGQFAINYLKTIRPGTGPLVTLLDWSREAWIVRQYSDLDRMLRQNIPSSSRTSLTMRGISAPQTLGSPGRALTPSSMESGSLDQVLRNCRGTPSVYFDTISASCGEHIACDMSTPRQPLVRPACLEVPDAPLHHVGQEGRQSYRPAAPIQRFNNKSFNWPAWFRHFRAVANVHGWDKNQRAL